ncbi:helix-turn-helix domain-containing protein [Flavobacterium sp. JP2137]|uniref:helix-turn-helix domain-containing protein n=1 Tax=Flavobacterium sp. JP2137 TaxID=3414510 RepID=UPI003D2FA361
MREQNIHIKRNDLKQPAFKEYSEKAYSIETGTGKHGAFEFEEASFRAVQLVRCDYELSKAETIALEIENEVVELHFRLAGNSTAICDDGLQLSVNGGQHNLLFHCDGQKKIQMQQTAQTGSFLEIRAAVDAVQALFVDGNDFQKRFFEQLKEGRHYWPGYALPISVEMYAVLRQLKSCPYTGTMKSFYLEAKITELLLLQADAYQRGQPAEKALKSTEIEKLHAVKAYIDLHATAALTLAELTAATALPTKTLTRGFKQLFHCTVWEYKMDRMMELAQYLLLEEDCYVAEVSDRLGYKNPQHFTAAFKRRFGLLPSALKR